MADSSLSTELLSGGKGVDRPVLWAHSCEMQDPSAWLQPNEFLMTIGHCIPAGSEPQRRFIAQLDEAGLSGMTIGAQGIAPRLTKAFFQESEARGFPVLRTASEVSFAAISRMVAASNSDATTMSVLRLAKLYKATATRDQAEKRSGRGLSKLFGTQIVVADDATRCVIVGSGTVVKQAADLRKIALNNVGRPASLLLERGASLDSFTLGHLAQVLEIDANEILRSAELVMADSHRDYSIAMLSHLEAARTMERRWGTSEAGFRAVAMKLPPSDVIELALAVIGIVTLVSHSDDEMIVVGREADMETIRTVLADLEVRAGVSARYYNPADLGGAVEEAIAQRPVSEREERYWGEYSAERVSLLARSASERSAIVSTVLGPLSSNDPAMVQLRDTLFTFLDNDQGWKETALRLKMHRQSIVYRLGRVEELTGRSVKRTPDLAEFWLARTCWEQYEEEQRT